MVRDRWSVVRFKGICCCGSLLQPCDVDGALGRVLVHACADMVFTLLVFYTPRRSVIIPSCIGQLPTILVLSIAFDKEHVFCRQSHVVEPMVCLSSSLLPPHVRSLSGSPVLSNARCNRIARFILHLLRIDTACHATVVVPPPRNCF